MLFLIISHLIIICALAQLVYDVSGKRPLNDVGDNNDDSDDDE